MSHVFRRDVPQRCPTAHCTCRGARLASIASREGGGTSLRGAAALEGLERGSSGATQVSGRSLGGQRHAIETTSSTAQVGGGIPNRREGDASTRCDGHCFVKDSTAVPKLDNETVLPPSVTFIHSDAS